MLCWLATGIPWLRSAEGRKGGQALGVFGGDGEGLGRSQVTQRALVIETLGLYGSVLK